MTTRKRTSGMSDAEREARDARIVALVVDEGYTLAHVGAEYGLTQERIRQILKRARPDFDVRARRNTVRENLRTKRQQELKNARAQRQELGRVYNPVRASSATETMYTDEQMLQALQEFYQEHGKVPTVASWDRSPSPAVYARRFGTWREARVKAGLPAIGRAQVNFGPARKWTEAKCLEVMYAFMRSDNAKQRESFGVNHYARWRAEQGGKEAAPSRALLIHRFGTWQNAKDMVISTYGPIEQTNRETENNVD